MFHLKLIFLLLTLLFLQISTETTTHDVSETPPNCSPNPCVTPPSQPFPIYGAPPPPSVSRQPPPSLQPPTRPDCPPVGGGGGGGYAFTPPSPYAYTPPNAYGNQPPYSYYPSSASSNYVCLGNVLVFISAVFSMFYVSA